MTNGGRWLQNHRETELWSEPDGGFWRAKLSQFSVLRQIRDQQGERIEVFYSGRGEIPGQTGFTKALDLGPIDPPVAVPPPQPGFVTAPRGGGLWLQNHRATQLHLNRDGTDSAGEAPQFSTYAQILKQDGPRILAFYYGNGTLPAGEYWLDADDLGPIPQPSEIPPFEPRNGGVDGLRPILDFAGPPATLNARPHHFQVIDEGSLFWHLDNAEFQQNFFCDCGPIAVAHAVNFTNWSRGVDETLNAHDGIVATKEVGAYGFHQPSGSFLTVNPAGLADAVNSLTGLGNLVVLRNSMDFDTVLKLARRRWVIVDNFASPGHISVVVAALDGSERLELVQHRVSRDGSMDAGDLIITRGEWESWNGLTIHPEDPLWKAPDGQDA